MTRSVRSMRPRSGAASEGTDRSAVVSRRPLGDLTAAYSGARLEEVVLDDGRRLVLKHLPSSGDWLTRATNGAGRLRTLWESGLLERARPLVDHTILDVVCEGGTDVVIMRDARAELLPPALPVARETSRSLLRRLAAMHDALAGEPPTPLCPIAVRYAMFAPAFHAGGEQPIPRHACRSKD